MGPTNGAPLQRGAHCRGGEVFQISQSGKNVKEACRVLEISEQTYYRWRREYGGLNTTQAKKLKALEKENTRLKGLVADLSLDNAILKEVLSKK